VAHRFKRKHKNGGSIFIVSNPLPALGQVSQKLRRKRCDCKETLSYTSNQATKYAKTQQKMNLGSKISGK